MENKEEILKKDFANPSNHKFVMIIDHLLRDKAMLKNEVKRLHWKDEASFFWMFVSWVSGGLVGIVCLLLIQLFI